MTGCDRMGPLADTVMVYIALLQSPRMGTGVCAGESLCMHDYERVRHRQA